MRSDQEIYKDIGLILYSIGAWKQMENEWGRALKEGKQVNVKINPIYSGNNTRPDKFNVKYSIDGRRPVILNFNNSPGGK
ncbi:DNA/RNA non-specific endonuclease [Photorhabdus sp. P32]|uniref:DNA/RNA non-specific endonuclease n=1 Tax=Photorhabdus sp. P32 TaxID=3117549 RepID=UPI00311ADF9E